MEFSYSRRILPTFCCIFCFSETSLQFFIGVLASLRVLSKFSLEFLLISLITPKHHLEFSRFQRRAPSFHCVIWSLRFFAPKRVPFSPRTAPLRRCHKIHKREPLHFIYFMRNINTNVPLYTPCRECYNHSITQQLMLNPNTKLPPGSECKIQAFVCISLGL